MDEPIRPGLESRVESPERRLRVFGIGLGAILLFASWRWSRKGWAVAPWAEGFGALFLAVGLLRPGALAPVERAWMAVVRRIAVVNTFLILAVFYYLVLAPCGLMWRLVHRDPLEESPDDSKTYWKPHPGRSGAESYRLPF